MKRSSSKQPPEIVFFTDRDLGRRVVPEALEQAGVQVERHDTLFLQQHATLNGSKRSVRRDGQRCHATVGLDTSLKSAIWSCVRVWPYFSW